VEVVLTPIVTLGGRRSDAHGRDHDTEAELALDKNGKFLGLRVKTVANLGGYISTFGPNIPTNLYGPLLAGVYATPAIHCNSKWFSPTPSRLTPIVALYGRKRPLCWGGLWILRERNGHYSPP